MGFLSRAAAFKLFSTKTEVADLNQTYAPITLTYAPGVFVQGQPVVHDGALYIAKENLTFQFDFDPDNWTLVSVGADAPPPTVGFVYTDFDSPVASSPEPNPLTWNVTGTNGVALVLNGVLEVEDETAVLTVYERDLALYWPTIELVELDDEALTVWSGYDGVNSVAIIFDPNLGVIQPYLSVGGVPDQGPDAAPAVAGDWWRFGVDDATNKLILQTNATGAPEDWVTIWDPTVDPTDFESMKARFEVSGGSGGSSKFRNYSFLSPNYIPASVEPAAITTTHLPPAIIDTAYSYTMLATGGSTPRSWSAAGLPSGFSINTSTGVISAATVGVTAGSYAVSVYLVTPEMPSGNYAYKNLTLQVGSGATGGGGTGTGDFTGDTIGTILWSGIADLAYDQFEPGGIQWLYDHGVDGTSMGLHYFPWDHADLDAWVYDFETNKGGIPSNIDDYPVYFGFYMGFGPAHQGYTGNPPGPSLVSDSDNDSAVNILGLMSEYISENGGAGFTWDWEPYRIGAADLATFYGISESAVRALLVQRGEEHTQAIVDNWNSAAAGHPVRILHYGSPLPDSFRELQTSYAETYPEQDPVMVNSYDGLTGIDYLQGAGEVEGHYTYSLEDAFYKFLQVPGWTWADAVAWARSRYRALVNSRMTYPDQFAFVVFTWMNNDPNSGSNQETVIHSPAAELSRHQAFAANSPNGKVIYHYGGGESSIYPTGYPEVPFNYQNYAPALETGPHPA